ncbi:Uncharacterised protein [BD1-7 clade bacterium]|uniref:Uncharacterized protein n=1 Tax=BD1-7 clade bacterium TaxID=2029982 RepID=A0A5S9Q532_9GAMM|nr:Uncharacterised protein [BD1-7 clade bacterium]
MGYLILLLCLMALTAPFLPLPDVAQLPGWVVGSLFFIVLLAVLIGVLLGQLSKASDDE